MGSTSPAAWVRRQHRVGHSHNDIVSYFFAAVTVFYGITLGLLAVSAWTNYSDIESKVDKEAEVISSLYRDLGGYPEPVRSALRDDLRQYTHTVIEVGWQQQSHGIVPIHSTQFLDKFQSEMIQYEPATTGQQIIETEAFRQFNALVEARRARINSVAAHMPQPLWSLVLLGALLTLVVSLFFDPPSYSIHVWLTICLATLLGLMIFLLSALDHPFRGKGGVSSTPLEAVYREITR